MKGCDWLNQPPPIYPSIQSIPWFISRSFVFILFFETPSSFSWKCSWSGCVSPRLVWHFFPRPWVGWMVGCWAGWMVDSQRHCELLFKGERESNSEQNNKIQLVEIRHWNCQSVGRRTSKLTEQARKKGKEAGNQSSITHHHQHNWNAFHSYFSTRHIRILSMAFNKPLWRPNYRFTSTFISQNIKLAWYVHKYPRGW